MLSACVAATLNLIINFRSGVWVGCPLCFVVFGMGMVSVVLLSCGWVCMVGVVWSWRSAWQGGGGCFAAAWWWECERDAFGGPCAGLGAGMMGGAWV